MSYYEESSDIVVKRGMSLEEYFDITDDEGDIYFLQAGEKLIFTVKAVKDVNVPPLISKVWTEDSYVDDHLYFQLRDSETLKIPEGIYYYEFSRVFNNEHKPTNNSGRFIIEKTAAQKVGD